MELKELLIRGAVEACGCPEGVVQLSEAGDKREMLDCFLERIDFCLAKNFPDRGFLKRHFGTELLKEKGIYIDEPVELHNSGGVLLGDCRGRLEADRYAVCRLFVKHTGRLDIVASANAFVMADVLDEAEVNVWCGGNAKVVVNLYAQARAQQQGEGQVKIVHKYKETYDL